VTHRCCFLFDDAAVFLEATGLNDAATFWVVDVDACLFFPVDLRVDTCFGGFSEFTHCIRWFTVKLEEKITNLAGLTKDFKHVAGDLQHQQYPEETHLD
jgi:hypothetical protein